MLVLLTVWQLRWYNFYNMIALPFRIEWDVPKQSISKKSNWKQLYFKYIKFSL